MAVESGPPEIATVICDSDNPALCTALITDFSKLVVSAISIIAILSDIFQMLRTIHIFDRGICTRYRNRR